MNQRPDGPADIVTRLRAARRNGLGADFCDQAIAEIERLRAALAAAETRAAYWEHDADCCGGCSECSRLAAEMQATAEKARDECESRI